MLRASVRMLRASVRMLRATIAVCPPPGETFALPVYLSLIPIVAGCSLSAMKEVSFNVAGFQ
eukprot:8788059-Pyramimonas_sp.AAC.1